jgi:hypothetical protein
MANRSDSNAAECSKQSRLFRKRQPAIARENAPRCRALGALGLYLQDSQGACMERLKFIHAKARLAYQGANGMNRAVLIAPEKTVSYYNQCAVQLTQAIELMCSQAIRFSKEAGLETRF